MIKIVLPLLLGLSITLHGMHVINPYSATKPISYFSLLSSDVKNIVYAYYKNPHCSHKDLNHHFVAVVEKKSEKEKRLIKAMNLLFLGAKTNAPNCTCKDTPLVRATLNGDLAMVYLLLQFGATPDYDTLKNNQALYYAARNNEWRIGQALIRAGARVHYASETGEQIAEHPFFVAARSGSLEMMEVLYGADIKISRKLGKCCLNYAPPHVIPFIVSHSDAAQTKCGRYALAKMIRENHIEVVLALLKAGVNPNMKCDKYDYRPIMLAAGHGNLEAAQLLIDHGASVEQEDYDDPLIEAIRKDNIKMVELIVAHRKKIEPAYGYARPLETAWNHNAHPKIIGILRSAGAKPSH